MRLQLYKNTPIYEKIKRENLLRKEFSFLKVYEYEYCDSSVENIMNFIKDVFVPRIDKIQPQFISVKKSYEITRHVNKEAFKYSEIINYYEEIEKKMINDYFYYLYVENDIEYCKKQLDFLSEKMEENSKIYEIVIKELRLLYDNTEMEKKYD